MDAAVSRPWRHHIDVSDTHVLRSQALLPVRLETLDEPSARLCPCTVRLAEPVDAEFDSVTVLSSVDATDSASEVVPTSVPTVCDILMLRSVPYPTRPTTNESAVHSVSSLEVGEVLPPALCIVRPKPAPRTVRHSDAVEARLLVSTRLVCAGPIESSSVELPESVPLVNTSLALPLNPSVASDSTAVSDSHTDAQHSVMPALTAAVYSALPRPPPPTVKLTDPVVAPFELVTALAQRDAAERATLALPTRAPAVTCMLQLRDVPCPGRQPTDVSDSHTLTSEAEPVRAAAEMLVVPMPPPRSVNMVDPLDAPLCRCEALNKPSEADKLEDKDAVCCPADTSTALLAHAPP